MVEKIGDVFLYKVSQKAHTSSHVIRYASDTQVIKPTFRGVQPLYQPADAQTGRCTNNRVNIIILLMMLIKKHNEKSDVNENKVSA